MICDSAGRAKWRASIDGPGARSALMDRKVNRLSSKFRCHRRAEEEPSSLLTAIAHELKTISGGNELKLRLRARRILTEAFHSIENLAPGIPQGAPAAGRPLHPVEDS